jgi:hypothetical protein
MSSLCILVCLWPQRKFTKLILVPSTPFLPSVIVASKARAYLSKPHSGPLLSIKYWTSLERLAGDICSTLIGLVANAKEKKVLYL